MGLAIPIQPHVDSILASPTILHGPSRLFCYLRVLFSLVWADPVSSQTGRLSPELAGIWQYFGAPLGFLALAMNHVLQSLSHRLAFRIGPAPSLDDILGRLHEKHDPFLACPRVLDSQLFAQSILPAVYKYFSEHPFLQNYYRYVPTGLPMLREPFFCDLSLFAPLWKGFILVPRESVACSYKNVLVAHFYIRSVVS